MLSYQHAFHAGGPADVHKHVALLALVRHLAQKEKPYCAVDVFAGEGTYDLTAASAAKTGEFQRGIGALWLRAPAPPPPVADYLGVIRAMNTDGALVRYPGSPEIVRVGLRTDDRLIVNDLHPAATTALRRWARGDGRVAIHARDGLEALIGLVPPPIRRGVVVVDPSYEVGDDYAKTAAAVVRAVAKWPTGIFVVWYPLLADNRHAPLVTAVENEIVQPALRSELMFDLPGLADAAHLGLRGSGLLIVNPPWRFDAVLGTCGAWLASTLPLGPKAHHQLQQIHSAT
jgi:23S rRNA (adenine2030-N6)-methyltransferase